MRQKKTLTKKFHKRDSKNVPQKWFAEMIHKNDENNRLKNKTNQKNDSQIMRVT